MERILMVIGTIRRLERTMLAEEDPRIRADYAETLDMLEHSLVYELDKYAQELMKKKQAA